MMTERKKINCFGKTGQWIVDFLRSEKFRITIILIIAAVVRIYKLSLEGFDLAETDYPHFIFIDMKDVLSMWKGSYHPPFFFIIYHFWGRVFGISKIALIMPALISGVASILVMYFLVKKMFKSTTVAFFTSLLTSVNLIHFHYSRDATEYSFFALIIFISLLAFVNFLETNRKEHLLKNAALYLLSATALFYTHNYAFMILLVQNLAFFMFFYKHKHLIKWWLAMQLVLLLLISPGIHNVYDSAMLYGQGLSQSYSFGSYLENFKSQIINFYTYNSGNISPALGAYLSPVLRSTMTLAIGLLTAFLAIIGFIAHIFILKTGKNKRETIIDKNNLFGFTLLLLLLLVPIALTARFPVVYEIKCYVFSALIYGTILALGICAFKSRLIRLAFVLFFMTLGMLSIIYNLEHTYTNEGDIWPEGGCDWKSAAEFLKKPENANEVLIIHVEYTLPAFLYEYNSTLFVEYSNGGDYPTILNLNKNNIMVVEREYFGTQPQRTIVINYNKLNQSLEGIDSFWIVNGPQEKDISPHGELFNYVGMNFEMMNKVSFRKVYLVRYERK